MWERTFQVVGKEHGNTPKWGKLRTLEAGCYYAKWDKPVRGRQMPVDLTYMWSLMNKINWEAK